MQQNQQAQLLLTNQLLLRLQLLRLKQTYQHQQKLSQRQLQHLHQLRSKPEVVKETQRMACRVYLSGKMSNRFVDDVKSERRRATEELARFKMRAVDPAAAEEKLWSNKKNAKISSKFKRKIMDIMVWHDLWLIRRCDVMLVLTG